MNVKRMLIMSGACGVLASTISAALAQDVNEVAEVVIVTGSYIRGTPEDAALPVDVISSEELQKVGAPTTVELLKSLNVSSGVLGDTNQFDARAQGSEGSGSVNLRGFGPERTLVLLNGRRMVNNPFTGAVDTNLIPMAAIGRVEVLKDGAAATYGSDAIAGVVNFITKENFRGFEIGADYKYIADSDGDYTANLAYGFGTDRLNIMLAAGYQHRSELFVKDREWARRGYFDNPQGGYSAAGNPSTFIPLTPAGAQVAQIFRDPQCANLGGVPTLSGATPVCRWQYTLFDALTEKEDRYQVFGSADFDITDSTSLHFEALYAETEVPIYRTSPSYAMLQTPTSLATGGTSPVAGRFFVPRTHPAWNSFIASNPGVFPADATGALIVANRPFAIGGNPLFGYGSSEGPRNYDGMRLSAGLSGEIGENFGWDIAVTYMEENARREGRDTAVNRYQLALRGLGGAGCNVAANTPGANGCFWYNPFSNAIPGNPVTGASNATFNSAVSNDNPELIAWMFPEVWTEQTTELMVVDAVINGTTGLKLGGGEIAWAFGGQFRDNHFESRYSDLSNYAVTPCVNSISTGIVGPGACTPAQLAAPTGGLAFLGGSFDEDLDGDVYAVFGELSVPITDNFQAQLAVRYEDYGGNVGATTDPKLSLRWQLSDALALRGSVGTTFRGPTENDISEGSITSLQDVRGTFRAVRTFGNPDLKPEEATTFNVGAILKAGGFSASLDYWSFDFEKPIVSEPLTPLVDFVFPNGAATCSFANPLVYRFAFSGANCATADIIRVDRQRINGPGVKTTGLDLSTEFAWDMFAGTATLGINATYVLDYDVAAAFIDGQQVANPFDAAGKLNYQTTAYPLPQIKGQVFAEYAIGAHNIRYTMNYIDDYIDQRTAPFVATPDTGGVAITAGKVIEDTIMHDLHYFVTLPWEMSLTASVENFTDEDPSLARLDLSYDPFTSSAFGRTYKLGLRKKFGGD
ncbi:iron complex outermembrane receptor protein [Povalibacter uvarum]|uniref:Iron complex outermembrane receptor protein n=1 Tax=Povalibacter uvarum TaxID=732238 RepID=A0A841HHU3_9GAMM|nr:TonB-dependent receptor [Povalibacter uvarum]MBB6092741.1 iron complex outermembrane receptor protein [Povalibacter uvarum]